MGSNPSSSTKNVSPSTRRNIFYLQFCILCLQCDLRFTICPNQLFAAVIPRSERSEQRGTSIWIARVIRLSDNRLSKYLKHRVSCNRSIPLTPTLWFTIFTAPKGNLPYALLNQWLLNLSSRAMKNQILIISLMPGLMLNASGQTIDITFTAGILINTTNIEM